MSFRSEFNDAFTDKAGGGEGLLPPAFLPKLLREVILIFVRRSVYLCDSAKIAFTRSAIRVAVFPGLISF